MLKAERGEGMKEQVEVSQTGKGRKAIRTCLFSSTVTLCAIMMSPNKYNFSHSSALYVILFSLDFLAIEVMRIQGRNRST